MFKSIFRLGILIQKGLKETPDTKPLKLCHLSPFSFPLYFCEIKKVLNTYFNDKCVFGVVNMFSFS